MEIYAIFSLRASTILPVIKTRNILALDVSKNREPFISGIDMEVNFCRNLTRSSLL